MVSCAVIALPTKTQWASRQADMAALLERSLAAGQVFETAGSGVAVTARLATAYAAVEAPAAATKLAPAEAATAAQLAVGAAVKAAVFCLYLLGPLHLSVIH